jgi:hypothetical protein
MVQCGVCQHFFNALKHQNPDVEQQSFSREDVLAVKSRSLAADDLSASLAQSYVSPRPAAPWWTTVLWSMLILLVTILTLAQLAWFNREKLLAQDEYRGYVESVCQRIDCRLEQKVDLASIELLSRDVRSHPALKNALLITATFINRAGFDQPYPDVALVLSDLGGNAIAQRQFSPADYLDENTNVQALMIRDVPVTMVMEVQDPGQDSVSYRFEFF